MSSCWNLNPNSEILFFSDSLCAINQELNFPLELAVFCKEPTLQPSTYSWVHYCVHSQTSVCNNIHSYVYCSVNPSIDLLLVECFSLTVSAIEFSNSLCMSLEFTRLESNGTYPLTDEVWTNSFYFVRGFVFRFFFFFFFFLFFFNQCLLLHKSLVLKFMLRKIC